MGQYSEALEQQSCAGKQHYRKRQFQHHQKGTRPACARRSHIPSLLQRLVDVYLEGMQRRRQAKQDARQDRNTNRENQDPCI